MVADTPVKKQRSLAMFWWEEKMINNKYKEEFINVLEGTSTWKKTKLIRVR